MINDFSIIQQIKSVKERKEELVKEEFDLSVPVFTDLSLISEIFRIFEEILSEQDFSPLPSSPHQRKKFIFIILFLYSPRTLAGYNSPRGLRNAIAKAIKLHDVTFISNNIENVAFLSQNDKYFKKEIEYLYREIVNRLEIKGLM